MSVLLERLRVALAPDYEVVRELGSGGMGVVFLAHDRSLDRPVAIKIAHPAFATAVRSERFIREARALASVSHPNIVPVHRAGDGDGIPYYVMDYLDARTLGERIAAGDLTVGESVRVGDDLLAALEAVHSHGIVHRDIKPSNVFVMADGRAMLADFGIAKTISRDAPPLTTPGDILGTPAYMPPEQLAGGEAGPRTDLCAVGMVLFEALTGRRWSFDEKTDQADWTGVPRHLGPVLRRALAWDPSDRWPDATSFRAALGRAARPRRRVVVLAGALAAAAALGLVSLLLTRPSVPTRTVIALAAIVSSGPGPGWLADSLTHALLSELGGNPDFTVVRSEGIAAGRAALVLTGTLRTDDGSFTVRLRAGDGSADDWASATGRVASWRAASGTLAYQLVTNLWVRSPDNALASHLPVGAMPRTTEGIDAFIRAERLFARAEWSSAYAAYEAARAADTSCAICDVRLEDLARWMRREHDVERVKRYLAAVDRFSPPYRDMIRASVLPMPERLQQLQAATRRRPTLPLASFAYADELFHRGPLVGRGRDEALPEMLRVTELEPRFAPGWEHLAAIAIATGDSGLAYRALARYRHLASADPTALELLVLNEAAAAWRFEPPEAAAARTSELLRIPELARGPDIASGPAYLMSFDVPAGVVWLGEQFARGVPRGGLEVRGFLAQVHGLIALGRPDSALRVGLTLAARTTDPDVLAHLAILPAALALIDSAGTERLRAVRPPLIHVADDPGVPPTHRGRAVWMLMLVDEHLGEAAPAYRRRLSSDPAGWPLLRLLDAAAAARSGAHARALAISDTLLSLDSASSSRVGEPTFRAMLHVLRAQWHVVAGNPAAAEVSLRWAENSDHVSFSVSAVESAEVDWALGTIARWRRIGLLERSLARSPRCRLYGDVVRLWSRAEPTWRALADSADARRRSLRCEAG